MAKKTLFTINLSNEEGVTLTDDITVREKPMPLDLHQLTEEDITEDEIRDIQEEMVPLVTTIESHLEAARDLNEQIAIQEDTIANNPYAITEDSVSISQENMCLILGRIGLDVDAYNDIFRKSYKIRLASENRPNAVTKLKLATEDTKGIVDKIIEKVRAAFKALVDMFKKLGTKIGVMLETTGKKATKLLEQVDSAKIESNLTDETKEKLNERWKYVQVLQSVKDPLDFTAISKVIESSTYALEDVSKRAKDPNFKLSAGFTKPEFSAKKELIEEGFTETCVIRFIGKCKVIGCKENTFDVVTIQKEKVEDLKQFNINNAKLKQGLEIAKKNGEGTAEYMKKVETIRKESEKVLDAISKKPSAELTDMDKVILSFVGKLGSTISLDIINNYRDFNKAIVATANLLINKKEDKEDKQEKDKDDKDEKKEEKKEEK